MTNHPEKETEDSGAQVLNSRAIDWAVELWPTLTSSSDQKETKDDLTSR